MLKVVVKPSTMNLRGSKRVLYKLILKLFLQETCLSAFCNVIYNIYGRICCIPENVSRFLKNDCNIPEERHLGLASLHEF